MFSQPDLCALRWRFGLVSVQFNTIRLLLVEVCAQSLQAAFAAEAGFLEPAER